MIYLVAMFEERFKDTLTTEFEDVSCFQTFHGLILEILPHDILIREDPYVPKKIRGIKQVPLYEGDTAGLVGREAALLRLADGTRSLRDIAEIDGTPYIDLVHEYASYSSKGLKIIKKII
ncbi:MAG: hypothetical protein ACTSVM_04430 [Candidatus Ranarchaeia archaeon]